MGSDDGNLYAIDSETGMERWRIAVGISGVAPTVADGVVYVAAGREDIRDQGNTLYALDAESGLERWRFETGGQPSWRWLSAAANAPIVVGEVVYFYSPDLYLYALNANDGTEFWRFETKFTSLSGPAVADGVVYIWNNDHNLYALNANDGTERWRVPIGYTYSYSSPVVADRAIFICFNTGNLRAGEKRKVNVGAVDIETGAMKWSYEVSDTLLMSSSSSPSVVDGVLYVGVGDGRASGSMYAIGASAPKLSARGTARVTEKTFLRGGPASTSVERAELKKDMTVTITGESVTASDGIVWWPVTVDETGDQGWVEASKLEPVSSGS